jgi:predicted PurR-regulated permease PerM/beta-phosphoglucomutase-like phosphatase (HAD superfamily)
MASPRWSNVTKIIVSSALALAAILLLVTLRQMIAPTIIAFLLTFVLSYPVNWVQQRTGWGRTTSVVAVYFVMLLSLALGVLLIVPRFDAIMVSLERTIQDLSAELQVRLTGDLLSIGPVQLSTSEVFGQAGTALQALLGAVTANPMNIARGLTSTIVSAVYIFVLNFWLLKDWYKLQRFILDLVPTDYQEEMRRLGTELGIVWQAFLRGQLTVGVVIGLMTWIILLILGMPNAGGLALLAGLMEFLPSIGPAISGTVGTVLALFQGSNWMPVGNLFFAVIVGIVYAIIGQLEGVYFIPRLVGGRVKLHPAVTFVGIITGALTFGVLGILLAAPVIASARVLLLYIAAKLADREPFADAHSGQSVLRIPGVVAGRKIEAILLELDGTVAAPDTRAIDWAAQRFHWMDRAISPAMRRDISRRMLTSLEAPINLLLNQLYRWHWNETIERWGPTLDRLRGFPTVDAMQLLPDVRDAIMRFSTIYKLGLISSRPRAEVMAFLQEARLDSGVFDVVVAREDVKNILPQVDPLLKGVALLGVQPDQVLVVSDSDVGLRAARAAEMATAGVNTGLALPENVRDADLVVADAALLAAYL